MPDKKKKEKRHGWLNNFIDESLNENSINLDKQIDISNNKLFANICPVCKESYQWDSFLQNFTCSCDAIIM